MRFTVLTVGSTGDVLPLIALGLGLKSAGHSVRIASHASFEDIASRNGLDFACMEGDPKQIVQRDSGNVWINRGTNAFDFARGLRRIGAPMFEQLTKECLGACRGSEALVTSFLGYFIAYNVSERLGIPLILAFLQPTSPSRMYPGILFPEWPFRAPSLAGVYNRTTHWLSGHILWQLFRKPINRTRGDILGLPPLPLGAPFLTPSQSRIPTICGFSPTVFPRPSDWGENVHITGYWKLNPEPSWLPRRDLIAFLEAGPPPIYFGFGSMHLANHQHASAMIREALRRVKQRGIFLTGWGAPPQQEVTQELYQTEWIPHEWLFPRMAAVVHHGGAGTTGAGLSAGVPNIITPFFADQPFWGRRVHELGAGPPPIPFRKLSADRLADAISLAIGDSDLRQRVAEIAKRIRMEDGVAGATNVIENHINGSDETRRATTQ